MNMGDAVLEVFTLDVKTVTKIATLPFICVLVVNVGPIVKALLTLFLDTAVVFVSLGRARWQRSYLGCSGLIFVKWQEVGIQNVAAIFYLSQWSLLAHEGNICLSNIKF